MKMGVEMEDAGETEIVNTDPSAASKSYKRMNINCVVHIVKTRLVTKNSTIYSLRDLLF